jgi:hypothetical protein
MTAEGAFRPSVRTFKVLGMFPRFRFIFSALNYKNMADSVPIVCEKNAASEEPTGACGRDRTTPSTSIQQAAGRLNPQLLYKAELSPLVCQFDMVKVESARKSSLCAIVKKEARQSGCDVVLVYAIRHPACAACREKGFELAQLAQADPKLRMITAVKETGSIDKSLLEYYQNYGGHNPMYVDEHWNIYHAMGGRRVSKYSMAAGMMRQMRRGLKKKVLPNFGGVMTGNLWTMGGVLVFDKHGQLIHVVYEPQFGQELDLVNIRTAVQLARDKHNNPGGRSMEL